MATMSEVQPVHILPQQIDNMEKKETTTVTVEAVDRPGSTNTSDFELSQPKWKPGMREQFPWMGLIALITVIACSVASILVLYYANYSPASHWVNGKIGPNVFLSIFNSLSNLAISMAVGQGIAIGWWRKALNGGTVKELHYSWSFSAGVSTILKKIKYFNVIALAALMTKFAVIDGVLYQKSISTFIWYYIEPMNQTVYAFGAQEFPITGRMGPTIDQDGMVDPRPYGPSYVVDYWRTFGESMSQWVDVQNCKGATCDFGIKAAGFAVDCQNETIPVDYWSVIQAVNTTNATSTVAGLQDLPLFSVNMSRSYPSAAKDYSSFILEMIYAWEGHHGNTTEGKPKFLGSCPLNLTKTTCELRPAILNYTLTYINPNSVSLVDQKKKKTSNDNKLYSQDDYYPPAGASYTSSLFNPNAPGLQFGFNCKFNYSLDTFNQTCGSFDPKWRQLQGIKVLDNLTVVEHFSPSADSKLEGFFLSFESTFSSKSVLSYNGSDWSVASDGTLPLYYINENPPPGYCNYTSINPIDEVIRRINSLSLLMSQSYWLYYEWNETMNDYDTRRPLPGFSTSTLLNQTVDSRVTYKEVYYKTNFHYVFGAVAATIVVVVCIMPVYYGYWQLGRKVTLGPFEIANAFQGPAFTNVRGEHVDEVIAHIGRQRFKYGEIDHETGKRLAFRHEV